MTRAESYTLSVRQIVPNWRPAKKFKASWAAWLEKMDPTSWEEHIAMTERILRMTRDYNDKRDAEWFAERGVVPKPVVELKPKRARKAKHLDPGRWANMLRVETEIAMENRGMALAVYASGGSLEECANALRGAA